jgi:ParB-like chromosome segregation protein Spo0J
VKTELWPLERLIDYARNPRKNDHAVDRVAAAIKEFGFRVPIIAKSDGLVVDGHLRLKAARKLGLAEVPVVLADDMSDVQVKAFRLSVNRMAELAEWDSELLALELGELGELGFELDLTGFGEDEIAALDIGEDVQGEGSGEKPGNGKLSDRFMLPPFSVLNAREGWWQGRKRAWLALGIKSELGRGGG